MGGVSVQSQIDFLKRDLWEMLYTLLSSTAVFCTVSKAEVDNAEQIVVEAKRDGGVVHCLTLTETGVKAKVRDINEELFFEFGKISELVNTLRRC